MTAKNRITYSERKEILTSIEKWHIIAQNQNAEHTIADYADKEKGDSLILSNEWETVEFEYEDYYLADEKGKGGLLVEFDGTILKGSGATLYINGYPCPLGSKVSMEVACPLKIHLTMKVAASSAAQIKRIRIALLKQPLDLTEKCKKDAEVLIIVPDYPSSYNLYVSAFAHSRNVGYLAEGLKIQVAAISAGAWYQTMYSIDGVDVISGQYEDLKKLLDKNQYRVLVTHFVDENLYSIFDGYANDKQLIFVCHGPETTYRILSNVAKPYFEKDVPAYTSDKRFDEKDRWVKQYSQKENVHWIFVSDWLKETSEKLLGGTFKHVSVIHNVINENRFPYRKKTEDDRKKILVIRKFDNIAYHSIDQVVYAIRELSNRPFFEDLDFEIYGDGNYYDVLTAPLHEYANVHLHRTFVLNKDIHELHQKAGILLCPSRHDSQGVAMCEGASSGLVVVGSRVTSNPYFMDEEHNHTLADPEDPVELADIIERLYKNPEEFLEISNRLSKRIREMCCIEKTVGAEVSLIREKLQIKNPPFLESKPFTKEDDVVLTVVVPSYNVAPYLGKCLTSLLNHRNVGKMEILVINDGSTDDTLRIAKLYEEKTNGIVKVIDKPNGGHGSTINRGIQEATGKYFKLVDGDDWVDSEALAQLIDYMVESDTDLILTGGSYAYTNKGKYEPIIEYDMMRCGKVYRFDDLLYDGYGFKEYGPILVSGNYRLDVLKKADFRITEKKPYVDMEFNSFAIRCVETVVYYDLDIYRYLIGRAGQTVSPEFWKKKYKDHEYIIFSILSTIEKIEDYPLIRKNYVYKHILSPMIDSQIYMFDQICKWKELDAFLKKLHEWPEAEEAALAYVIKKDGSSAKILKKYKYCRGNRPLIRADGSERNVSDKTVKEFVGLFVPYGLLKWRADRMNNQ